MRAASRTGNAAGGKPVRLDFEDNTLLAPLYGEHDRNLVRIEQQLGVTLTPRGNRLAITGPESAVTAARAALLALYERLERGRAVDGGEIDAAVRMALADAGPAGTGRGAGEDLEIHTRTRVISPRSRGQIEYIRLLNAHELVFGLGPAGTGKTYLAVAMAVSMLIRGQVDRIVLSRPAVEAGERLGFLPGDLKEKIDPYLQPLYDALNEMLPPAQVVRCIEVGEIEIAPLAFMRGRTLANAYIILDEAQNTSAMQMKMFLTRMGENSRMVVTGDISQMDLPEGARSGLTDATALLDNMEGVGFAHFTDADVVRHNLVGRIVRAYDARDAKSTAKRKRKG